jgi:hypothetical protein
MRQFLPGHFPLSFIVEDIPAEGEVLEATVESPVTHCLYVSSEKIEELARASQDSGYCNKRY